MTAEIIPITRRSHARRDGWREQLRSDDLGTMSSFGDRFATHLRARPASEATIYRYRLAATQLAAFLGDPDVVTITRSDVERFIVERMRTTAGSTVNGTFVALCQFFAFVALDVAPDRFTPPTDDMRPPAFEQRPVAVPPAGLIEAMIAQAKGARDHVGARTFEGIRDEVMLRMFADTGARLAEITHLTLHDLLGDRVRLTGKSKGKGPVERQVCIGAATQQALKRYLRVRGAHPHARADALWIGQKGAMSTSGVRQMVWKRSLACGSRIHPHQFRHAMAHGWKSADGNHDGDLMEIMGWRTETMLHRYGKSAAAERALEAHKRWLEQRQA